MLLDRAFEAAVQVLMSSWGLQFHATADRVAIYAVKHHDFSALVFVIE